MAAGQWNFAGLQVHAGLGAVYTWAGGATFQTLQVSGQEGGWSDGFVVHNYLIADPANPLVLTDGGNRTATLRLNASGTPEVNFQYVGGESTHEWDATTGKYDFWSPPQNTNFSLSVVAAGNPVSISNVVYKADSATEQLIDVTLENSATSAAAGGSLLKAQISYTTGTTPQVFIRDASYDSYTRILTIHDPVDTGSSPTLSLPMLSDPAVSGNFQFNVADKTLTLAGTPPTVVVMSPLNAFTFSGVTYTKDAPLLILGPPYAFQLTSQIRLNVTTPSSQSIH